MTFGLSKDQIGVTESQIDTFGELIFQLSHNVQDRRGDPVRRKDFTDYERQRAGFGMSDAEIAERIGLSKAQVTAIRNIVERRKVRTTTYYRLNELGGGKRFRADEFVAPEDRPAPSGKALALRTALQFDPDRTRHYVGQCWWGNDTLGGWLQRHAGERPDHEAVAWDGGTLSYAELEKQVATVAAGLRGLGIGSGDVVAVQLPNTADCLVAYLAIAAAGAVMTTIYMPYRTDEIRPLLAHSGARAFVCPPQLDDFSPPQAVLSLKDDLALLEHVITVGGAVDGCIAFDALKSPDGKRTTAVDPPVAADPFLLLYTSGTTASPKGVPLNYHTMLSNARLGAPEHGFTANDRLLSAAPFGHLFGLYSIHLALAVGATMVLLPAFSPPGLVQTLTALKPTGLFAAPAHIAACLGMGLLDDADLSSLKLAILSGAQVPPDLARAFDGMLPNGSVSQLWGMTELQAGTYTRPGDSLDVVAGSAGRASPGAEIRVVDENNTPLPAGEEGELQVRGVHLFSGYFDNPGANAAAFTDDGWFRTGDLAVVDGQGNMTLTGRSKDIINRGGVKFNPLDIERLLDQHPRVAQSAIVPVPDDVLGERACVFVVPGEGDPVTLEELCAYLLENGIAKTKLPERLEFIDAMPLTATRKIIKGRLKPSR